MGYTVFTLVTIRNSTREESLTEEQKFHGKMNGVRPAKRTNEGKKTLGANSHKRLGSVENYLGKVLMKVSFHELI